MKTRLLLLLLFLQCIVAVPTAAQTFDFEAGFSGRYQRMNGIAVPLYEHFVSAKNSQPSDALGGQVDIRFSLHLQRFSLSAGIGVGRKYFNETTVRYALYQSPGGNTYGGNIDNGLVGHYWYRNINISGGYRFLEAGIFSTTIEAGLFRTSVTGVNAHLRGNSGHILDVLPMHSLGLTVGFAMYWDLKIFTIVVRPLGSWLYWQNRNTYEPFGVTLTAGVSIPLRKFVKPNE